MTVQFATIDAAIKASFLRKSEVLSIYMNNKISSLVALAWEIKKHEFILKANSLKGGISLVSPISSKN